MDVWSITLPTLLIVAVLVISVLLYYIVCRQKGSNKFYNVEEPGFSINRILPPNTSNIFRRVSDNITKNNSKSSEETEDLLDSVDVSNKFEKSVLQIEGSTNLLQSDEQQCISSDSSFYSPSLDIPEYQQDGTFTINSENLVK